MEINLKNNFLIGECIHGFMIWPMGDSVLGPCLKNYGEYIKVLGKAKLTIDWYDNKKKYVLYFKFLNHNLF